MGQEELLAARAVAPDKELAWERIAVVVASVTKPLVRALLDMPLVATTRARLAQTAGIATIHLMIRRLRPHQP